jgi:Protein of unknown function (DUF3303)
VARYMVIETYTQGAGPVYAHAADRGRMLPPGLEYVDSWIEERTLGPCFQVMETEDPALFDGWWWTAHWSELVDFEIVPMITATERPPARRRLVIRRRYREMRWAIAAASSRFGASSLRRMCETWTLAVLTLMTSAVAISRFV